MIMRSDVTRSPAEGHGDGREQTPGSSLASARADM
jgi:hypothetical protein